MKLSTKIYRASSPNLHRPVLKCGYTKSLTPIFTTLKSSLTKALTLCTVKFRLGYCGSDEEVKALPSLAIGAAGSFWELFSEKSALGGRSRGRKALSSNASILVVYKNVNTAMSCLIPAQNAFGYLPPCHAEFISASH